MIRPATSADIEQILTIAQAAYGPRDYVAIERWLEAIVIRKDFCVLLGTRAFTIGMISQLPWQASPTAFALFLTAHPQMRRPVLEPLYLFKALLNWAASQGVSALEAGSGSVYKVEPLLRRLRRPVVRLEHFRVDLT